MAFRRILRDELALMDPDYYEWETHIFFDDAMEPDEDGTDFVVNSFVRLLIDQGRQRNQENEHNYVHCLCEG